VSAPKAPRPGGRELRAALGWKRMPWASAAVFLVIGLALPFLFGGDYIISLMIQILIFALLNQSWNLTIGMCGIWNFGQLAIFAIGAYTQGIVTSHGAISPWPALLVSGLVAAFASMLLILPALRLQGIYAALLTFSFAEVFRLLVVSDNSGLTGGTFGLGGIRGLFDSLTPDSADRAYLWLLVAVNIGVALLIYRLMQSPFGVALVTMRDSTRYAVGMGVNRRAHVLHAQALSGFLAGLSGALYAAYYSGIAPSVMGLTPMGLLVLMIVIGGLGTVAGPIVGTFVVMVTTELLRDTNEFRLVALGAVLIVILALKPAGLTGLVTDGVTAVQRWMNADKTDGRPPGGAGSADEPHDSPTGLAVGGDPTSERVR
jgi:branched-chain amino acid transport system permease protein